MCGVISSLLLYFLTSFRFLPVTKDERIEVASTFRLYFVDPRPTTSTITAPSGTSLIHFDLSAQGLEEALLRVSGYEKFPGKTTVVVVVVVVVVAAAANVYSPHHPFYALRTNEIVCQCPKDHHYQLERTR